MTVFQKAWDLLKIGYIPGDVQNPQDIDLPPDHPALNPRPADSISDMSMAHRNAGGDSVTFTVRITVDGIESEDDAKDRFMAAIYQAADMEEAFYNHDVKVEFV